jgi:NADPH:quinone reductase-like Zn-dependent oxidoreductase
MTERTEAWLLHAGATGTAGELVLDTITLPELADDRLLVEPLFGCWGGNMTHALQRSPIDVCRQRGEPWVVLGNAAVVRDLAVGPGARAPRPVGAPVRGPDPADLRPGRLAMLFSTAEADRYGYTLKALAYDAPGTMGCLARRMVVRAHELLPLPEPTAHALPRWSAFSGSSITAWSNWELAHGVLRLLLDRDELPAPHVWGWGGGTTLAELDLAARHGCRTIQLSADPGRRAATARAGVTPLARDRALSFDETRFAGDLPYRRAYLEAEARFLADVARITDGEGVHIFVDYLGQPVHRATLKALARQGVITSAGWKLGMQLSCFRAAECIQRRQHIHTHYARYPQGLAARDYAEATGWLPEVDPEVFGFEQIPELARRYAAGELGFYPIFTPNPA